MPWNVNLATGRPLDEHEAAMTSMALEEPGVKAYWQKTQPGRGGNKVAKFVVLMPMTMDENEVVEAIEKLGESNGED